MKSSHSDLDDAEDYGQMMTEQPSMKKMKKAAKFVTSHRHSHRKTELGKESPMVAKVKHMLYMHHNAERALEQTKQENFDFQHTRNQFITTSKNVLFQKTQVQLNSYLNRRKMSHNVTVMDPGHLDSNFESLDVVGLGLVTQKEYQSMV